MHTVAGLSSLAESNRTSSLIYDNPSICRDVALTPKVRIFSDGACSIGDISASISARNNKRVVLGKEVVGDGDLGQSGFIIANSIESSYSFSFS